MSVFRNTGSVGTITSTSFAPHVDFTAGDIPNGIVLGDLDGDGKVEIAMINAGTGVGTVSVFRNTAFSGSLNSSSFAPAVNLNAGYNPFWLKLGDLDGDGKPEIILNSYDGQSI